MCVDGGDVSNRVNRVTVDICRVLVVWSLDVILQGVGLQVGQSSAERLMVWTGVQVAGAIFIFWGGMMGCGIVDPPACCGENTRAEESGAVPGGLQPREPGIRYSQLGQKVRQGLYERLGVGPHGPGVKGRRAVRFKASLFTTHR